MNIRSPLSGALVVLVLSGCAQSDDPQWQLSVSSASAKTAKDELTLRDPDAWAVAVTHQPTRMGAVLSTQRLASEWPELLGDDFLPARINGMPVSISAPSVFDRDLVFPAEGAQQPSGGASLVMAYDRPLKNYFDLPPAAGWTYTVTFGPTRRTGRTLVARFTSPVTVAFEGDRTRTLASADALPQMIGPAYLVLLDSRTYSAVPVIVERADLEGSTLTITTGDSAPSAGFNRGALFVDGLPTPA